MLRSRLKWYDMQLMRDIIFVLGTQGWEKAVEEDDSMDAINRIVEQFTVPLQGASANIEAVQFISVSTLDYRAVWWRIFHAPNASEWSNALILAYLLFSLPASNAKVERVFSHVSIIKTNKRILLSNDTLGDLLLLSTDQVPLQDFCPDAAVNLWWRSKSRRPDQRTRRPYRQRSAGSSSSTPDTATDDLSVDSENDTSDSESDRLHD